MEEEHSFEKYMRFPGLAALRFPKYTAEHHQAYIKISSYVLNHEGINIAKMKNPQTIQNLINKYDEEASFMAESPRDKDLCLIVLQYYAEYLKATTPKDKIFRGGELIFQYPEDPV